MTPLRQTLGLIVSLAVVFAAAGIGSLATTPNIPTWYAALDKPDWTPPNWLFGPVWTLLYLCMAIAAWLVWRHGGISPARGPLALYLAQLALNAAWSWLFFGFRMPGVAFFEILVLLVAILGTAVAFRHISQPAALLMVPYLGWVAFAAALNFAIWQMN